MTSKIMPFLVVVALLFSGCQSKDKNSQIRDLVDSLTNPQNIPSREKLSEGAQQEVEKLFVFEYKVAEVKAELPAADLEAALQALGQERWECFALQQQGAMLRLFCKRRPKTYLRFIPRMFP
jgi:hypothetical protein